MMTYLNFHALENLQRHSLGNCCYGLYGTDMGLLQTLWYVQDSFLFLTLVKINIQPFTNDFLRADIHELLSPDLLH